MEIEPILLQSGITESIVSFFHSRTNNKHMTIVKVSKPVHSLIYNITDPESGIRVDLTLKENVPFGKDITHYVQYTIDVAKIRQKIINLLINKTS